MKATDQVRKEQQTAIIETSFESREILNLLFQGSGDGDEDEMVQTSEDSSGSGHSSDTQSKDEFSGDQVLVAFQNNHQIITFD